MKQRHRSPAVAKSRSAPLALLAIAAAALAYVVHLVAQHTIWIVQSRGLLPRWDLATHLGHGWVDYHLLTTGQVHRLLADLWMQGYWPPVLSIYQVPFYVLLGGGLTSGLWSSATAFLLTGLTGSVLLWRQWRYAGVLSASVFLALLMSSPFLLAYASLTMTEMLGAFVQLVVLLSYAGYRRSPGAATARAFALSLTVLFFTKYNYFLMLGVPLAVYEWLQHTSGWSAARRAQAGWESIRRVLSSPTGTLLLIYIAGVLIVTRTGGFEFHVFGQRVSVHGIGNSGHVVLYILLARLWYLHRRGRIPWDRVLSADVRVRPLLLWFVVPVTIWFASPYPNHIRDFANLVINHPMGEPSVEAGVSTYLDALRSTYFYREWILALVVGAFGAAAVTYRRQPSAMQVVILAVPMQLVVIALHQTRFPRFLLLTVVLLCLVASSEVGRWFAGSRRRHLVAALLAPVAIAFGMVAARTVVAEERFRVVAFEHYTDSPALRAALRSIRAGLRAGDRLAFVGYTNELSPALFRWELGPPSGVPCFPSEIGGARRLNLSLATKVLLVVPLSGESPPDDERLYLAQRASVLERVARGEFTRSREFRLTDMQLAMQLYERTAAPERQAACW